MTIGYDKPLYILPFDHRNSYVSGMFKYKMPLNAAQQADVVDSKQVIYEGFKQALADGVSRDHAGLLVDEEFGTPILKDAAANRYVFALSTEKSGVEEFQFEYGDDYQRHIEAFDPTFAKVLVRYNPDGDADMNKRQTERLAHLSEYCSRTNRHFMFELLVPATDVQLEQLGDDKDAYDAKLRPDLMIRAVNDLRAGGVDPSVWKIEGLDHREDCERFVAAAQAGDRAGVGCIILGRGSTEEHVVHWLQTAAAVPGFIGFAVGRTSFWDPVAEYVGKKITRQQAVSRIAVRYRGWVDTFEARQST